MTGFLVQHPIPTMVLDFRRGMPSGLTFSRASTGTYFNSAGVLTTVAAGMPRFDHDPVTLQPRGLLIEEGRTNRVDYSTYTPGVWSNAIGGLTLTPGVTAPDGTTTAVRVSAAGGSAQLLRVVITPLAVAAGATYSVSFFARQIAAPTGALQCDVHDTTDLSAAYASQLATNVWRRVVVTGTFAAGRTVSFIDLITDTTASFTLDFWGLQLEAGSFATSYIPTSGAAATRAADLCTMTVSSIAGWSATEGTLVAGFTPAGIPSGFPLILQVDDGSESNSLAALLGAGRVYSAVRVGGAGVFDNYASAPAAAVGTRYRVALAAKSSDYGASVNGGAAATGSGAGYPAGLATLRIGRDSAGTLAASGWVERISYFNTRLPNATLQALTV